MITPFLRRMALAATASGALLLSACQTTQPYDYTALKAAKPKTILVLPPTNNSVEVSASYSFLSKTTAPLAENGYYVLPVALVDRMFRENGLTSPADIHNVSPKRLHDIFDADAALYIDIKDFGSKFLLVDSVTTVTAHAKLIELKSGQTLWEGDATANDAEGRNNNNLGLLGLLVTAVVRQVMANAIDQTDKIAGITAVRLLASSTPNGLLVGPRHPTFQTQETK